MNEAFAKKFDLGANAVGKMHGRRATTRSNIQIVGLVKDAKYTEVKRSVPPLFYLPYRQDTTVGAITFYVRSTVPAATLMLARFRRS